MLWHKQCIPYGSIRVCHIFHHTAARITLVHSVATMTLDYTVATPTLDTITVSDTNGAFLFP